MRYMLHRAEKEGRGLSSATNEYDMPYLEFLLFIAYAQYKSEKK